MKERQKERERDIVDKIATIIVTKTATTIITTTTCKIHKINNN